MRSGSVAFFLPVRKGSQRVKNKNTRPFAGIEGGLLENKLRQLTRTENIDEIILSTNDEVSIAVAKKYAKICERLKIMVRPDELCLDTTSLQDLIEYVPSITTSEHILWGHVTTPFVDGQDYDAAVEVYRRKLLEGYDSLVSAVEFRNFLLNQNGQIVNNTTPLPWPRTQDLEILYEMNHAMFITSRAVYEKRKNRIGERPFVYTMDKTRSFDIDWEEDFKMGEMMYKLRLLADTGAGLPGA